MAVRGPGWLSHAAAARATTHAAAASSSSWNCESVRFSAVEDLSLLLCWLLPQDDQSREPPGGYFCRIDAGVGQWKWWACTGLPGLHVIIALL